MFYDPEFAVLHSIAVALGVLLLVLGLQSPRAARTGFAALFSWACVVNWTTVLQRPEVHLEYGPLAVLSIYMQFIDGLFARHIVLIVGSIATCQGLIALLCCLEGGWRALQRWARPCSWSRSRRSALARGSPPRCSWPQVHSQSCVGLPSNGRFGSARRRVVIVSPPRAARLSALQARVNGMLSTRSSASGGLRSLARPPTIGTSVGW